MSSTKRTEEVTVESVLDASLDALQMGVEAIHKEIELISKGKAGKSKHDKASRIAFLSQRVGAIADSVRKIEAARAKRSMSITKALVVEWFRQLDTTDRGRFVRELQQIDSKRSGLA